ncbi:hypothetical protein HN902_04735 [Candidatus Woesearchaeota archaeon]|jgi:dolichyl-phosphooligosaccharide-protein glycotransferase|nr:hypothetical protein [Candidatus Woesearchaeota archaeon]
MEENEKSKSQEEKIEDEEVNIDFSKIKAGFKNFFSKDKKESKESTEDELDLKDVKETIKKGYKETKKFTKKYGIILLILIPIFLSIFFRIQPAYLPITEQWAENSIDNFNMNVISQSINAQFPSLPQENKQRLIEEEYKKLKLQDKVFAPGNGQLEQLPYNEAIEGYRKAYKSRLQNDNGQTYLIAIDPYYYARYARNLDENGHLGDVKENGISYETKKNAPSKKAPDNNYHNYVNYITFKISRAFGNKDIMKAIFYVPLIIATLAIIPCFFLIKKVAGNLGATAGASLLAVHTAFMTRTVAGFADTDPYNVFFPLMIAWLFIGAFEAKKTKTKLWLGIGSGLLVGLYSRFWSGWWYIFDFIIATIIIYGIIKLIMNSKTKKETKTTLKDLIISAVPFFFAAMLSVAILFKSGFVRGIQQFFYAFLNFPLSIIQIKEVALGTIWPNVLTTVAELNPASVESTIGAIGGGFLFFIAVVGIILTVVKKENGKRDLKYAIFLTLWFVGAIYGSTKGLRFTLLLVPAFSIAIGAFIGIIYNYAKKTLPAQLDISKGLINIIFILLAIGLLVAPAKAGWNQAVNEIPSMNDAWWTSLTNIKESSEENAIITSWWDFGHWFKYAADRGTNFDGASQNSPKAHWVGKLLLTSDEKEAFAIIRMLDCGGNGAYDKINDKLKNDFNSILLIKNIILQDETGAKNLLESNEFSENEVEEILTLTHCAPPEAFVIASEDMVGKAGVWGHFGSWDFEKASMVRELKGKTESESLTILQTQFELSEEQSMKYYDDITTQDPNQWISRWPGYASGLKTCSEIEPTIYQCIQGVGNQKIPFILNTTSKEIYAQTTTQDKLTPKKFAYFEEGIITQKEYNNSGISVGITVIKKGEEYQAMATDPLLSSSMFTRMFFNNGNGLNCFEKFDEQTQITGGKIYVYKVDWQCQVQTRLKEEASKEGNGTE